MQAICIIKLPRHEPPAACKILQISSTECGILLVAKSIMEFCRTFQMLGLQGLGSSGGFERLHYLLESAFDGPDLSMAFMKVMLWPSAPV